MPNLTAEVWDSTNENLISSHETLCEAIESTNVVPPVERNIYYLNGSTWLRWVGPRPTNPPGR